MPGLSGDGLHDLGKVGDLPAGRTVELGMEQAQDGDLDAVVLTRRADHGLDLLPPGRCDGHWRQPANHCAVRRHQDKLRGARYGYRALFAGHCVKMPLVCPRSGPAAVTAAFPLYPNVPTLQPGLASSYRREPSSLMPEVLLIDAKTTPYAALLLRLTMGILFILHGLYLKVFVFTMAGTSGFFASLGLPGWFAWLVMLY